MSSIGSWRSLNTRRPVVPDAAGRLTQSIGIAPIAVNSSAASVKPAGTPFKLAGPSAPTAARSHEIGKSSTPPGPVEFLQSLELEGSAGKSPAGLLRTDQGAGHASRAI